MLSGFQSLLLGSSYYTKWVLEVVVAIDITAHLGGTASTANEKLKGNVDRDFPINKSLAVKSSITGLRSSV